MVRKFKAPGMTEIRGVSILFEIFSVIISTGAHTKIVESPKKMSPIRQTWERTAITSSEAQDSTWTCLPLLLNKCLYLS